MNESRREYENWLKSQDGGMRTQSQAIHESIQTNRKAPPAKAEPKQPLPTGMEDLCNMLGLAVQYTKLAKERSNPFHSPESQARAVSIALTELRAKLDLVIDLAKQQIKQGEELEKMLRGIK